MTLIRLMICQPAWSKRNSILDTRSMSKLLITCLIVLAVCSVTLVAQDIEVRITVDESSPSKARVEGRFARPAAALSFLQSYAGFGKLAERISDIKLADADKRAIEFKKLQPGEYLAESGVTWFAYVADVTPLRSTAAAAHVSWLTADGGM